MGGLPPHEAASRPDGGASKEALMSVDPRSQSRVLLDGPDRAGARAMLKAIGFA